MGDPNETNEIAMANSRLNIRKLIKDGLIIRKPPKMHSRARCKLHLEAKRKGQHSGMENDVVQKRHECPAKSCGCAGFVCCDVCFESTGSRRKLTRLCIASFI